jgi:hypothetical protein
MGDVLKTDGWKRVEEGYPGLVHAMIEEILRRHQQQLLVTGADGSKTP